MTSFDGLRGALLVCSTSRDTQVQAGAGAGSGWLPARQALCWIMCGWCAAAVLAASTAPSLLLVAQ